MNRQEKNIISRLLLKKIPRPDLVADLYAEVYTEVRKEIQYEIATNMVKSDCFSDNLIARVCCMTDYEVVEVKYDVFQKPYDKEDQEDDEEDEEDEEE